VGHLQAARGRGGQFPVGGLLGCRQAAKPEPDAAFARDHGDEFGRLRLIAKFGDIYKAIALDDIETRDKVLGVATKEHLDRLFDAA